MSAYIVLFLRILLVIFLYAFLYFAIKVIWGSVFKNKESGSFNPLEITNLDNMEQISYSEKEILIGRDPLSNIFVDDETVSHHHARIFFKEKNWWLEDVQSTNGTFLNREKIVTPVILINGDEFVIGKNTFRIEVED